MRSFTFANIPMPWGLVSIRAGPRHLTASSIQTSRPAHQRPGQASWPLGTILLWPWKFTYSRNYQHPQKSLKSSLNRSPCFRGMETEARRSVQSYAREWKEPERMATSPDSPACSSHPQPCVAKARTSGGDRRGSRGPYNPHHARASLAEKCKVTGPCSCVVLGLG